MIHVMSLCQWMIGSLNSFKLSPVNDFVTWWSSFYSRSYPIVCAVIYISIKSIPCFIFILQLEACIHSFFDELRDPNARLPNGRPLPPLFNFKPQGSMSISFFLLYINSCRVRSYWITIPLLAELKGASVELLSKLVPEHARKQCPFLGF